MDSYNKTWLPHLKNAIPREAFSHQINMYTIALEGWRRGLDLKFYKYHKDDKFQIRYSLGSKDKKYHFDGSRGSKISKETINTCIRKDKTKEVLMKNNIPVPKGRSFNKDISEKEMINYTEKLGFPVVIKPVDGSLGKGVISNIKTTEHLSESITYVREDLGYPEIIIEQYIPGKDIRIYIVDGKVKGAIYRIPANIIGDGISTIDKLIKEKNISRKSNPHLYYRSIKLNKQLFDKLKIEGLSLNSVLPKNKRLFLRNISNLSAGGDPIDITDELSPKIKDMAIKASQAVGAKQCGVDVLLNTKNNTGVVIEINSKAHIGSHLFPLEGKSRDIPKAIIDLYFPELANQKRTADNLFFDYGTIVQPLREGTAVEVKVPKVPKVDFITCFLVKGDGRSRVFRRWIRRRALLLNLCGQVHSLSSQSLRIVVGGEEKDVYHFRSILLHESPRKYGVKELKEKKWDNPIPIGFKVYEKNSISELNVLNQNLEKLEEEKENIVLQLEKLTNSSQKEKIKFLKKINSLKEEKEGILESRSWKITSPLRKVRRFFEKLKV